ncbi:MAG: alkaline phosphatase family protein [Hyphomicrobiaceae bacterium]
MRRAIIVVLDGLRRDMLDARLTPFLARHAEEAETFVRHRSVFPSATRVVSSSMATGCYPARHELAGNTLVLIEDGRLVAHDAGHPGFLQHKRRVTGRSLAVPTMAERVREHGGAEIYSNVSPGAAYAHDPDGHGTVYHRAGSFGPGRTPVTGWTADRITIDAAGDRALAERFVEAVVAAPAPPALGVLWLAEPDYSSHAYPLGSPAQLAALRGADATAGFVIAAVEKARAHGDDILLVVGSDHGHQSVGGVVDVDAALVAAGLKAGPGSRDVMAVSNGTSALVYVHPDHAARVEAIGSFLTGQSWAGEVIGADRLGEIGQAARHGLAFAVAMAATEEPNAHGIAGTSWVAKPAAGKPDRMGCGQHGGLGRFEQSPFLLIQGSGFTSGARRDTASSAVDIAPTVMTHLGLPAADMDGRPLQAGSTG